MVRLPRFPLAFSLLLALASARPAVAQEERERAHLHMLQDSLSMSHDSMALRALEASTIDTARIRRDDPVLHLRLGIIALRLGEVGKSAKHYDDAAGEFEWAAELKPDWPWPWYGLGLAEAGMPDRAKGFAGGLWTMLSMDRDSRAGKAFAKSVEVDPTFTEALLSFSRTARDQRVDAPTKIALDAMRAATANPSGWSPELLLERGRLERVVGHYDSARVAFQRAQLLGVHNDLASIELARTLPMTGDTLPDASGTTPVEVAYYAGAGTSDPEVVDMYRHDLKPMVNDSVLAVFDKLAGAARVAWLREFWGTRAATDLQTGGARLAEHYRRWEFALQNFRLPPFKRVYDWGIEIYKSGDEDIDDRGIVYLRQGEPTIRIQWPISHPTTADEHPEAIPGSPFLYRDPSEAPSFGNETWRYIRPEGDMVLNFIARGVGDYHMVESVMQLDVGLDAMQEHARDLPGLARMLHPLPNLRRSLREDARIQGRKDIAVATTTDRMARDYPVTLGGRALWLSAGERDGMPLVHIVYSVDAQLLRTMPPRQDGALPLTVRAVFLDKAGGPLAMLDTVQYIPRPDSGSKYVAMRAEVPVPPGAHRIRLGVEASSQLGGVYALDSIVVPDLKSDTLALSSLLIGVPGRSLPWLSGPKDTTWLDATNSFVAGDTLGVYFETYGVKPGMPYSVHFLMRRERGAIARIIKGRKEAITLTERITFEGTRGKVERGLDLAGLEPGSYSLEVTVEGGGRSIVRRRVLTVRDPQSH